MGQHEGDQRFRGGASLRRGTAAGLRENRRLALATGGVGLLPLRVVEVVIGAVDQEARLRRLGGLGRDGQRAVERPDALQVGHIAVAARQQHGPGQASRVEHAARLAIDRADLEQALERHRADACRPRAGRLAELIDGRAHAFAAARMAHQADVREVDCVQQREAERRWRRGHPRVPPCQLLQVAQHQPAAAQVQAIVASFTGGRVDAPVGVDRDHDEAVARERPGQVFIAQVARRHPIARRAGAAEGVVAAIVVAHAVAGIETPAGAVVAMQENHQRMWPAALGPVDPGPELGLEAGRDRGVTGCRQLVVALDDRQRGPGRRGQAQGQQHRREGAADRVRVQEHGAP